MTESRVGGWREADRALLEAATPGPWELIESDRRYWPQGIRGPERNICGMHDGGRSNDPIEFVWADAEFIAAAPDIVRRALDALDAIAEIANEHGMFIEQPLRARIRAALAASDTPEGRE